jgi:hypothetical protein
MMLASPPSKSMSPFKPPVCLYDTRARADVALSGSELLHMEAVFRHGVSSDEENSTTNNKVESVIKYKLPTYQAAAVVVRTAYIPSHSSFGSQAPTHLPFSALVYCPCRSGIATSRFLQILPRRYKGIGSSSAAVSPYSHLHLPDLQRERHDEFTRAHQEFRKCPHARCALPGEGEATPHHPHIRRCHFSIETQSLYGTTAVEIY